MNDSPAAPTRTRRAWVWVLLAAALVVAAPLVLDYVSVGRPVSAALARSTGTDGFAMSAHRQYRVNPGVLVINLGPVEEAAPLDIFRGLVVTAGAMHERGADFERVHLARGSTTVFTMDGSAFRALGRAYDPAQNPLDLVAAVPAKLHRPNGRAAFRTWEGDSFDMLGKRLEDVTAAVHEWMGRGAPRGVNG